MYPYPSLTLAIFLTNSLNFRSRKPPAHKDTLTKSEKTAKKSLIVGSADTQKSCMSQKSIGSSNAPGIVITTKMDKEMGRALSEHSWYHGLMPREEIEEMLKEDDEFLVRKTDVKSEIKYTISVRNKGRVRHILFSYTNSKWCLRDQKMNSIIQLVEFYMNTKMPVQSDGTVCTKPVPRPEYYILHDHIEVKEKLGGGAFGDVHRGILKRCDEVTEVAVKKLKGQMLKKQRCEFIKEARMTRKFVHKNIVRLIGIAPQEEPIMIVLELAPGGSLKSHLKKHPDLTAEKLTNFTKDACRGMCYLSGRKVIHRDIAARNCLMGRNEEIKISDFGLSVANTDLLRLDKLKNMPIKWLAPETLKKGEFSTKSDVWSFGVMIWEIFSHCKTDPFPGETNAQAKAKIMSGNSPMSAPPGTPSVVSASMMLCFTQDSVARPEFDAIFKLLAPKESPPPKED
ncbi:hypothetical protein L596_019868 [Steinernema carpocapsae]|uniref:Tyrosine-protein kinase n=1 Tax=Steinernema carpocapsae TaxID=34508 RepID=A0A4U5MRW4_STECR|nr:hypothetical protein L596_019868 [Steinernema carpocapsae]